MDVTMVDVKSSNVEAVGHDRETLALVVRFRSRPGAEPAWYRYEGVGPGMFSELLAASSKGRFVAAALAGNPAHPCRRLTPDEVRGLAG